MQNRDFLHRYRLSLGRHGLPVELHRTSAGTTYRGHEIATGREVAIELIPWSPSDPASTAEIEALAATAQRIDHPNFPKLHAFGIEEGQLVYVTDYFEGHSAEAWVAGRGPLPLGAVLRVAVQVVSALGAANFHRLHHRAINPANIIFVPGQTAEGEWPAIKLLLRFGSSHAAASDDAQAATAAAFASPEQRRGGEVDFASAVFSLGCTIWFLLTGAPPTMPGGEQVRAKVATLRGVPKIVRHLLGRMLSVDLAERPRDPVVLQAYLQTCLAPAERTEAMRRRWGVIPAARPRVVVARTPREWPVKSLALAALLLLCAALAAVAVPGLLRSRNSKTAPRSAATTRSELPPNLVKEPEAPEEGPVTPPPIAAVPHDEEPALADKPIAAELSSEFAAAQLRATATPTAVAAADQVEESTPNELVTPSETAPAMVAVSPNPTAPTTVMTVTENVAPAPHEPIRRPTVAVAREAEPSLGEPLTETVAAAPVPTPESTSAALAKVEEPAPNESITPAAATPGPKPTVIGAPISSSRKKSTSHRAATVAKDSHHRARNSRSKVARAEVRRGRQIPKLRVGSHTAELVGTTSDGRWILSVASSGERVIVPPPPGYSR